MPLKRRKAAKTRVVELKWLNHGEPMPKGWEENGEPQDSHHHHYGRMILKSPSPASGSAGTPRSRSSTETGRSR